jgi:hypothetical protein
MNIANHYHTYSRNLICALAACILTVVMLGGIGHAPAQAAQRAMLLQA